MGSTEYLFSYYPPSEVIWNCVADCLIADRVIIRKDHGYVRVVRQVCFVLMHLTDPASRLGFEAKCLRQWMVGRSPSAHSMRAQVAHLRMTWDRLNPMEGRDALKG